MDKVTDRLPVPTDRALRVMKWAVFVAAVAFSLYLVMTMAQVAQSSEQNARDLEAVEQDRTKLETRVDAQGREIDKRDSAIGTANDRLKDAGEKPVTVPNQAVAKPEVGGAPVLTSDDVLTLIEAEVKAQHPELTTAQKTSLTNSAAVQAAARVPEPEDGADGPSLDDLRPVIRSEVAKIPVPEDGVDGVDGSTPSDVQVSAAITALCGGSCKGEKGDAGSNSQVPGPPGADSQVPGPMGPGGPAGPQGVAGRDGDKGDTGDAGAPGRGIATIVCNDAGDWVFTFTDESTATITGPCRASEPTPTDPTPTSPEPTSTSTS